MLTGGTVANATSAFAKIDLTQMDIDDDSVKQIKAHLQALEKPLSSQSIKGHNISNLRELNDKFKIVEVFPNVESEIDNTKKLELINAIIPVVVTKVKEYILRVKQSAQMALSKRIQQVKLNAVTNLSKKIDALGIDGSLLDKFKSEPLNKDVTADTIISGYINPHIEVAQAISKDPRYTNVTLAYTNAIDETIKKAKAINDKLSEVIAIKPKSSGGKKKTKRNRNRNSTKKKQYKR